MAKPKLHLDNDVSYVVLWKTLNERRHDVTHTPREWMALDADDRMQLLETTARGRFILTFNISDFAKLAQEYPEHGGTILAHQTQWRLPSLITALDRLLSGADAEDWQGQVRWLNEWSGD
ncbi:MAG: DUF5615 family PIN-like protein [Anaerolineales bacterium]|nr:DUF5615 family PIN-like protein [Anaerolineales bacterium]